MLATILKVQRHTAANKKICAPKAFGAAGKTMLNFSSYLHKTIFNQQRSRAGTTLIPSRMLSGRKALVLYRQAAQSIKY
jgi:hypothetical protein